MAPSLIERLLETTDGPLRTCVVGLRRVLASTTPSSSRPRPASPRASPSAPSTRSTSTTSPTGGPGCRPGPTWGGPADLHGAAQRLRGVRRGRGAGRRWGTTDSDFVLIREPMIVQAFIQLFDRTFERALPIPADDESDVDAASPPAGGGAEGRGHRAVPRLQPAHRPPSDRRPHGQARGADEVPARRRRGRERSRPTPALTLLTRRGAAHAGHVRPYAAGAPPRPGGVRVGAPARDR